MERTVVMDTTYRTVPVWLSGLYLAGMVLACALVAWLGSAVTELGMGWYRGLEAPAGTPPDWVFGPVWSVIYLCIALSGWLVARRPHELRGFVLWLFLLQLILNLLWSILFFGTGSPDGALIIILLLLGLIVVYGLNAHTVSPWAGYLFVPYGLWVLYATYLNAGFMLLNW